MPHDGGGGGFALSQPFLEGSLCSHIGDAIEEPSGGWANPSFFSSTVTTTSTCVPVVIQDRDALLDPSPPLCVGHSCTNSWEQQGRNAFPSTMHPGNTGGRMCLALHQHGMQLSKGYGAEHERNGI